MLHSDPVVVASVAVTTGAVHPLHQVVDVIVAGDKLHVVVLVVNELGHGFGAGRREDGVGALVQTRAWASRHAERGHGW